MNTNIDSGACARIKADGESRGEQRQCSPLVAQTSLTRLSEIKTATARLKFLCRRGMKELDEILNPFFDKHFMELSPELKEAFAELLNQEEPTLFDWLVLGKEGGNPNLKNIIKIIRNSK